MTHTSSSIYTIDVGPRLLDGNREISLLYDGTPFFCATHRDVQWAFVASFYAPGDTANDSNYVAVPDGSGIPDLVPVSTDPGRELPFHSKTTPQEYLCVFHREELKDSNDRYVFSQPNTLCTSYTVRDGTSDHFVLHNISPTNITPGRHGVFIFGMRQTTRWGHASPLEIDGEVFQPAADTWWMASPLVVKPVYVQVPHGTVMGAASASLTGFSPAAGPPLSTDLQSPPSSPLPGSGTGFNFGRCALIDAQVLHQFPSFYDNRYLTVLLTGAEELGLAVTKAWNELDILTWYWTPHRVRIPDLPVCNSFLTVTVSEHPSLQEQVIFLYDSQHVKIHVIRIPNLQSGVSKMELLFTFPCGNSPTVLPCARPSTPQLILVANYPVDGSVALFDPAALLSTSRADNCIATLPLAICVEAQKQVMEYETPGSGSDGSQPSTPQSTVLLKPPQQRRIEGIAFQEGSTVLYNYQSCASSNASRSREQGATGGRRRCEVSLDAATSFPSLQAQQDPLLDVMLEALEVAIGSWYVHKLEYTLLNLAWEAKKKGQSYSFTAMLCELLVESVKAGVQGDTENGKTDGATAVPRRASRADRLWAQFTDPYTLTATSVEELATSLDDDDARGAAVFVPTATNKFKWPLHVCGICLVTLHILYESCKLQERYWPLLETLAILIEKVSILLGWRSYASVYSVYTVSGRSAGVLNSSTSRTLRDTLSEEQLLHVYKLYETHSSGDESPHPVILTSTSQEGHVPTTPFLLDGTPPSLGAALRLLLQREGISALAFPSLKQPRKALWPILEGLTPNHPITVANRVYLLYRDCFDPLFARDGAATAASTGKKMPWWQRVCHATVRHKLSTSLIHQDLNVGVAYPIELALLKGKDTPGDDWSDALFAAVGRLDLVTSRARLAALSNTGNDVLCVAEERAIGREYRATCEEDDGVLMRPDFPQTWKDGRLDVVQAYFNTTAPITLPTQSHPRDILKELAKRACAFSIGRGMFTLCTQNFKVRDSIPIPKLNLDGRTSDGIVVTNNFKEFHEENMMWPLFHNGCAAGLRFLPLHNGNSRQSGGAVPKDSIITRHWVVYQTQRSVLCPASRAGLLLAAGILGHLKVLQLTDIYSLLASPQLHYAWREATTMAVMLGLSCSFRSTNNDLVFRCLSMHVQSLTPNAEEIEVSRDVQTVALVSIGLLCQQTPTNGFLVEMLLSEMSRLPSDEHCMNREGYALGAGFGLGLLLLGLGDEHGIPNVEGRLLSFMDGARRESIPCAREGVDTFGEINVDAGHFLTRALFMQTVKESSKCVCTRVYEGHCYNIAVSGPAAVAALGLMYLKTNNESICRRLLPPNRYCEMQALSPSLCLLRTMMASLVMWSSLFPTRDSLYRFVPSCLVSLTPKHGRTLGLAQQQVQYLMMNLGHCIAGAALALGFRYAGSMDADAREVIVAELEGFLNGKIGSTGIQVSTLQRSTGDFEACVSSCCVAASLLVAGSGDMKIFSVLQQAEKRPNNSYGLQMALSMSFGLLFLGGGRLTVSTATPDVAALIIALHPVWPKDTEDNVHHLQALRHLYGLAVVPRIIETVDAVSNRPVSVPVRVILRKGRVMPESLSGKHSWTPLPIGKEEQEVRLQTPCLYPPSDMIERIEIRSTAHYPRVVQQRLGEIHEEGLSIRVLEKPSTSCAIVPGETADKNLWKVGALNMSERRLHHWLHRVFSRHSGVCETLAILDSVKLLVSAQRQLSADTMDSEEITSPDFGRAVELTLHRRYQQIFMHGPTLTHTTHPLHRLLIKLEPWRAVVQEIAEAPAGTEGFPFDFTTLAVSTHVDEEEIHRWFAESLYFLLDWSGEEDTAQLSEVLLRSFGRGLQDPSTRMMALLQMNSHLLLPLETLEQLVECCMAG